MGYPPDYVWAQTPRQIAALAALAMQRRARERAADLTISALGARGEPDDVKRAIKDWDR